MKKFHKILFLLIFLQINALATNKAELSSHYVKKSASEETILKPQEIINPVKIFQYNQNYWGVFWINLIIAAIGVYSIFGFAAGIISAGISYFIVNGDKKGFRMAVWGAIIGAIIGLSIRLFILFI